MIVDNPMVLQKEISCLVEGIVFHGQTCPLVLQQSAFDFLRLKQITSIQKRTSLRIWRWTLNLIYPNIAFDWIGLSQSLQEFPASVSYALLFTSIKYPLVIYHSYWKWPIYTWFTCQKCWVVHSYVKLNQRLNPMTFQEKSWFPSCFPPMLGFRAQIWSFTEGLLPFRPGWRTPKVCMLRSMKRTWPGRLMRSRRDAADWRIISLSTLW